MPLNIATLQIFHITDISNLNGILRNGGLHSDATLEMVGVQPSVIGDSNIKRRRLTENTVPCCAHRFVVSLCLFISVQGRLCYSL